MVALETGKLNGRDISRLSERERSILDLAIEGLKDRAIADKLGISKGTVGTYWTRIRRKVGPVTRAQIAAAVGRAEGRESNSEMAALMEKLNETCDKLDAEASRRKAVERYLQLLRRLVKAVARYTAAGKRTELIIGAPDLFEPIESDILSFRAAVHAAEADGVPRDFMGFRLIPIAAGEVLVAKFA